MNIALTKASSVDCAELHAMQTLCFRSLLDKYRDYDSSPGAEPPERTARRLADPASDFYFICRDGCHIGALRVRHADGICTLKQLFILPEHQGHGYAQSAIRAVEALYPSAKRWQLDTILQEKKLCHLYEKMGYSQTGRYEAIKDGMDLVYYAKDV